MAAVVTAVVAVMVLWASPTIAVERAKLLRSAGIQTLIQTIMPGRFHSVAGGQYVFYVQAMNRDHTEAEQVFMAHQKSQNNTLIWDVLWADKAYAQAETHTGEEYLILQNGKEYQGVPGQAKYQVAQFAEYKARLPHPTVNISDDVRTMDTSQLWPPDRTNREKLAELEWRLSIPCMVLILTLVAVPLSRVSPRSGKYAKLLPAVIIYIIYANLMFIARDALVSGKIPSWLGMWWIHFLIMIIGLLLIRHNRVKLA
jgi:lipopolysaccharide export system permease protein